jgi:hypothetical protein
MRNVERKLKESSQSKTIYLSLVRSQGHQSTLTILVPPNLIFDRLCRTETAILYPSRTISMPASGSMFIKCYELRDTTCGLMNADRHVLRKKFGYA